MWTEIQGRKWLPQTPALRERACILMAKLMVVGQGNGTGSILILNQPEYFQFLSKPCLPSSRNHPHVTGDLLHLLGLSIHGGQWLCLLAVPCLSFFVQKKGRSAQCCIFVHLCWAPHLVSEPQGQEGQWFLWGSATWRVTALEAELKQECSFFFCIPKCPCD